MPRLRSIDRLRASAYLAVGLMACGGTPGSVVPIGATTDSETTAAAWIESTRSTQAVIHRFRWLFRDREGSGGGRGSARITPGDSLRFDVVGPLGTGRGAAFVVGDVSIWAEPEEDIQKLVPNYPLLWAMLGIARLPDPVGDVSSFRDGRLVAWRFVNGADTVEYAILAGPPKRLVADVRLAGKRLGRVETMFGSDGAPRSSRLDVPGVPARLDITYVSTTAAVAFDPETWIRPEPEP